MLSNQHIVLTNIFCLIVERNRPYAYIKRSLIFKLILKMEVTYQSFLWIQTAESSLQSQDEKQNRSHKT